MELCWYLRDIMTSAVMQCLVETVLFLFETDRKPKLKFMPRTHSHTRASSLFRDLTAVRFSFADTSTSVRSREKNLFEFPHIKGSVLVRFWIKNSLWKVTHGCHSSLHSKVTKGELNLFLGSKWKCILRWQMSREISRAGGELSRRIFEEIFTESSKTGYVRSCDRRRGESGESSITSWS